MIHARLLSPDLAPALQAAGLAVADRDAAVVVSRPAHLHLAPVGLPRILFVPEGREDDLLAEEATRAVAARADAYAGEPASLAEAARWLTSHRSQATSLGIRYLGSLGERRPPLAPRIGDVVPLTGAMEIGRSETCAVCLRQGAHSDQNTVARKHAILEPGPNGVRVRDCKSSNGTWVRGERIDESLLAIGDELAIAWSHRFVVVGP